MANDFEHKPKYGAIFKQNKTKEGQPDWKGEMKTSDGVVIEIAAWEKQGKKGMFLSLKCESKEEADERRKQYAEQNQETKHETQYNPPEQPQEQSSEQDDLPF